MNSLIYEANDLLTNRGLNYAFCGGFAIDLFLGYESRIHGDIDISVYLSQRNEVILYMQSIGFNVYEMLGGGKAHYITDVDNQKSIKRNIFCFKDECEMVLLEDTDEKDIYVVNFFHTGQTKLNFIEFLFDDKENGNFVYARNKSIKRGLTKTVLYNGDIPYLCPEICLLYKSTSIDREGYRQDYDLAIKRMNNEQKGWLNNSLRTMYPDGHEWIVD